MDFGDADIRGLCKLLKASKEWEPFREYLRRSILKASMAIPRDGNDAFYRVGYINGLNEIYQLMLEAHRVEGKTEDEDGGN